jgi:RNA polymerase sigma-70 factor (ECF subfamily)
LYHSSISFIGQQSQVREALMSLPKEQRMVIELAYFQGWTHSEIAEGCQLPLGMVKARMRLGLLRLKRMLEQKGINGS